MHQNPQDPASVTGEQVGRPAHQAALFTHMQVAARRRRGKVGGLAAPTSGVGRGPGALDLLCTAQKKLQRTNAPYSTSD